jgi:hypothetical protein
MLSFNALPTRSMAANWRDGDRWSNRLATAGTL